MIQIQCDRCDKAIQVDDPKVGQKVTCPSCGNVSVIRSLDGKVSIADGRQDRAAQAGYPPALGPEADVMTIHPAMLRARPMRFFFLCAVLIAGVCGGVYFYYSAANVPLAVGSLALGLLAFGYLVLWRIRTRSEGLKITTKRTIDHRGLFSKDTSDVLHVDIKNIQIKQTFLDRVWNVGEIAMSSSAENEEEISIKNVPNPEKVRQVIDLYRQM